MHKPNSSAFQYIAQAIRLWQQLNGLETTVSLQVHLPEQPTSSKVPDKSHVFYDNFMAYVTKSG